MVYIIKKENVGGGAMCVLLVVKRAGDSKKANLAEFRVVPSGAKERKIRISAATAAAAGDGNADFAKDVHFVTVARGR